MPGSTSIYWYVSKFISSQQCVSLVPDFISFAREKMIILPILFHYLCIYFGFNSKPNFRGHKHPCHIRWQCFLQHICNISMHCLVSICLNYVIEIKRNILNRIILDIDVIATASVYPQGTYINITHREKMKRPPNERCKK